MTALNEINNDKTKVPDEFIFRSVSLARFFLPKSMSKLIDNRCICKLIIKVTVAYVHARAIASVCVFMF